MHNWKFHLKCLFKGVLLFLGIGILAYLFFGFISPIIQLFVLLVLIFGFAAYAFGRALEGVSKNENIKECLHPDFWFDRTLSYCPICKDEHMNDVCTECGKAVCEIRKGK